VNQEAFNKALAEQGVRFALAVTGAAMTGATDFFRVGGASSFVEEICIPYSPQATKRLLGRMPSKHVCLSTAERLAEAMVGRCFVTDTGYAPKTVGIGVEGALYTEGQRVGRENVVFYAAYCINSQGRGRMLTRTYPLTAPNRGAQEQAAAQQLHDFMLECADLACL